MKSASPDENVLRGLLSPMIVRHVTLLPQPDSPTIPSVWPRSTEKVTPPTALHDAVVGAEARPQVPDLQESHQVSLIRGSITA